MIRDVALTAYSAVALHGTKWEGYGVNSSIEERVAAAVRGDEVQSLAVVIWRSEQREVKTYGAAMHGGSEPPAPKSLYALGSVTKPYTAMAVLRLVVQGALNLDAPAATWLHDLERCQGDLGEKLSVRHLLTHCCGLVGDWFLDRDPDILDSSDSLAELVSRLPEVPAFAAPGERYSYSNLGYILAGRLLEVVTGRTYEQAMHELVLGPLGLDSTGFSGEPGIPGQSVPAHIRVNGAIHVGSRQPDNDPVPRIHRPSGGLFTNADDLACWLRCHLTEGESTHEPDLWRLVVRLMQEPQSLRLGPKENAVGVGWSMVSSDPLIVRHGGDMHGFIASCALAPRHGWAVGVLSNLEGSAGPVLDIERMLIEEVVPNVYAPPLGGAYTPDPAAYLGTYLVPPERRYSISLRDRRLWLGASSSSVGKQAVPQTEIRLATPEWGILVEESPWPLVVPFELGADGKASWVTVGGRAARRIEA